MKSFFALFAAACLCLSFAGCGSVGSDFTTGVKEKFTGPTYRTQVYQAESKVVFVAARKSAEDLGFRITRAGAAQGVIEGVSAIASDDRLRGSHQKTISIKLTPAAETGTEVAVLITEIIEDDFNKGAGQGTETPLRDTPLYDVFFRGVTDGLVTR